MIALDSETTGLDLYHGAKPFLVTAAHEDGTVQFWEWDVDPLTREVHVPAEDQAEINELLTSNRDGEVALHNSKFDVTALDSLGASHIRWSWRPVRDTLLAGHLLATSQPHDLTSMVLHYLGEDLEPYEKRLEEAVLSCRRVVQQARLKMKRGNDGGDLALWRIAEKNLPEMPSARDKTWKIDSWLPRVMARHLNYVTGHPWQTVLSDYANADSVATLALWRVLKAEIERRGLWNIYAARLKLLPVLHDMERRGPTSNGQELEALIEEYVVESERASRVCVNIAAGFGYDLKMPKSGNNGSLRKLLFGTAENGGKDAVLKLPMLKFSDTTGEPSLDKEVLERYEGTLPANSSALAFVKALSTKRRCDTAVSYMSGYKRFWLPISGDWCDGNGWYVLHPNINPTGTITLRLSSSHPNEQNISKKEGFNLRRCFGPAPGREWWSLDAKNIELRIPAYESNEEEFIRLFERPDEPPFFGSNHLLVSSILFPKEFSACRDNGHVDGRIFKKKYSATLYDRVKRGNFCVQYGGQEELADATYGVEGAFDLINSRFEKQSALNRRYIAFANRHGYVETTPDRSVDPEHGYPILCQRTSYGKIKPTVPFNYHVQGTACWWMIMAMVRCHDCLQAWSKKDRRGYFIALTVHDELVFDFPKGTGVEPWRTNLPRIKEIKRLMEVGGDYIGVPTPVSVEYHSTNYAEGLATAV